MYEDVVRRLRKIIKAHKEIYGGSTEESVAIERAADAIEKLQQAVEQMKAIVIAEAQHTEMYDERDKQTLMEMAKSLPLQISPNKDEKSRWIPVTEEPPLKVGDDGYNGYLIYANGYYEVADYAIDKYDNVPYFHVDGELELDVTHYMPLPQPPAEEQECDNCGWFGGCMCDHVDANGKCLGWKPEPSKEEA